MQAHKADLKTQSRRTLPAVKNRRMAERESMHWRVTYTYQVGTATYFVDGVTRDLCRIGCGIRGTIMPPVGARPALKCISLARNYPYLWTPGLPGWQETILGSDFMNWIRRTICESVTA